MGLRTAELKRCQFLGPKENKNQEQQEKEFFFAMTSEEAPLALFNLQDPPCAHNMTPNCHALLQNKLPAPLRDAESLWILQNIQV